MGFYPIVLELEGCACLVVGGGVVAERKVEALLAAGARITVVSPQITDRLESRARAGRIRSVLRPYRHGDVAGYRLAFVATDDDALNDAVASEARARGIWVNVADDPAHCDFILPSVLRRGELTVAVSTGGASPALSRMIREELETYFTADYGVLARVVASARRELRRQGRLADGEAWHQALDPELRRLIAAGLEDEAQAYLVDRLGAPTCV